MKFSEIPYERVDIDGLVKLAEGYIARLKGAGSAQEAGDCVLECSKKMSECMTMETVSYIRYTMNTEDVFYTGEQEYYAEKGPLLSQTMKGFTQAMLACPFRAELEERFAPVLFVNAEMSEKTISDQVLGELMQENKLVMEYQKLLGGMEVRFNGRLMPITKLVPYKLSEKREVRRSAYLAEGLAFDEKKEEYDRLFTELTQVRAEIARKLELGGFTELGYLRMSRNCYTAEDAARFREQVKRDLVPRIAEIKERQRVRIGVDDLRLYDDPIKSKGGNPKPVKKGRALYNVGVGMYREMGEKTRAFIDRMDEMGTFDLESRIGKMAGGYCTWLYRYTVPFIFANFNGTAADVEVFTHEGGHAFAFYVANEEVELPDLASPTLEGCEVHSMSMEFLSWPWLERYYGKQAERAKLIHLLNALEFIPYGCMVDEFQHRIYERPNMSAEKRKALWLGLEKEYRPYLNNEEIPFFRDGAGWQRQLHIYMEPFYYIDYCIAQTCALEILDEMLTGGWDRAWEKYYAYVKLGGRADLLTLLDRSGYSNPFAEGTVKRVTRAALQYIEEHEDIL